MGKASRIYNPFPSRPDVRAIVEAWDRTYAFYSSVGITITSQRYRKGGLWGKREWRNDPAYYLAVDGETLTQVCYSGGCSEKDIISGGNSVYGEQNCQKVLNSAGGLGMWHVTDYIEATYTFYYHTSLPRQTWFMRWE